LRLKILSKSQSICGGRVGGEDRSIKKRKKEKRGMMRKK
jgi:hypothetical protein